MPNQIIDDLNYLLDEKEKEELKVREENFRRKFFGPAGNQNENKRPARRRKLPRWMKVVDQKATRIVSQLVPGGNTAVFEEERIITPEIFAETCKDFGFIVKPEKAEAVVNGPDGLFTQHLMFERTRSALELEEYSTQTAVGIGSVLIKQGRKNVRKFVLLENEKKSGYHFPGGTVRPGELPERTLAREYPEECGLVVTVIQKITSFLVDELGNHTFIAYEVKITGGKLLIPDYNPEEPIIDIIFLTEEELKKVCEENGTIIVNEKPGKGILPSHRRAFLEYLQVKDENKFRKSLRRRGR